MYSDFVDALYKSISKNTDIQMTIVFKLMNLEQK